MEDGLRGLSEVIIFRRVESNLDDEERHYELLFNHNSSLNVIK